MALKRSIYSHLELATLYTIRKVINICSLKPNKEVDRKLTVGVLEYS